MSPSRTVLRWSLTPEHLFLRPLSATVAGYEIVANGGEVIVTLEPAVDPLPNSLRDELNAGARAMAQARATSTHQVASVAGPRIEQHRPDRMGTAVHVMASAVAGGRAVVGRPDVIVQDAAGNIVSDTKTEREAHEDAFAKLVAAKAASSPVLRGVLESYERAISDPSDELVHLYEVREALCTHFDGERAARAALGIAKTEWNRLGGLTNDPSVAQGRHRGAAIRGRRDATAEELDEARDIVRRWIHALARDL